MYGCFACGFYLHKRCAEILSDEIHHPYHPNHPLCVEYFPRKFVCEICRDLSKGFLTSCKQCEFKLEFNCAFNYNSIQRFSDGIVKSRVNHFSHSHTLTLFNSSEELNDGDVCYGCKLRLRPRDPAYGCFECSFYLHKSCVEIPRKVSHPYHPSHYLHIQLAEASKARCDACREENNGLAYWCSQCDFGLHLLCAVNSLSVISALKNDSHRHDLFYFVAPQYLAKSKIPCNICGNDCEDSFYLCLECSYYVHMECIPIPLDVFKRDVHMHTLTLRSPETVNDGDISQEYYCYTCENKRNPEYYFYYCKQCSESGGIYTAHIECVASSEVRNF
ncbi:hypothetical protein K2173_021855 [Erythroxylum novogranatense]|uniref:Zinc finger PHD-type domain-containing protein n=1 Tax=Erythroxylum novogranatense TaxID=1862640 RepID=A0AAV8T2B9_9ROSI|nr:hypothetical protein K2173_021855 [Erythroxylum novogranatense]